MKIRKIVLIVFSLALLVLLAFEPLLGMSPLKLKDNLKVGSAMGAKLACSGHYLSGFDAAQNLQDLASYSPAIAMLDVAYLSDEQAVEASLLGFYPARAVYRDGLGCTLEVGDTTALDAVQASALPVSAAPWPAGDTIDTQDPVFQAALSEMLAADNRAGLQTRALVAVSQGKVVAQAYAPGIDGQTPLLGWSMGKSLISILLGTLEYQGLLSVDEDALFSAWAADSRAQITLENMLQMSSGLDFDEAYVPGSDATHMLFTAHSASEVALGSELAYPPGEHFAYSSGTTNLLARLWQQRVGGDLQQALDTLRQQLFQPLGMSHSILEPDSSGMFVGSSYIYASALDWARLGQFMLNEGELNGVRLLSADWVARSQKTNASSNAPAYGYQFWLNAGGTKLRWPGLPADAYAMMGNRQQVVMIIPSLDTVLVRLGWTSGGYPLARNFSSLLPLASPQLTPH